MSKHTSGPWTFQGGRAANGIPILMIFGQHGTSVANAWTVDDARLIVAAPQLLEALREAENALADYVSTIEKKMGASLNYGHAVLRKVRAAIKAAEGA